jgi:hypothetical protein
MNHNKSSSLAADRRRAREEYYRENSAPGTLSSSLTSDNSSMNSSHSGGPNNTVLSHVTEGTTETSSRHSNSGGSSVRSSGHNSIGGGGRSINTNDPPAISEDHYYRERNGDDDGTSRQSSYSDDYDDDDEEELRTLATMDTNTFRELREKRRKSKGSDTEGGNPRSSRSSAIRHRSHHQQQQRSDPRGIHPRENNRRVRYRGGNPPEEDDYTDAGGSYDSRSISTDGISRSTRSTYRSNRRSRSNNNDGNNTNLQSFTSQQWQMLLLFALGLVLVIKAGIVEVKLEKSQMLRGVGGGGDRYSHLDHLSGSDYYKAPTVMNARSLEEGGGGGDDEEESDVGGGEDSSSPSETFFKDAVEKLESEGGGSVNSQGETEKKDGKEEEQQIEQELEEAINEGEDVIISNEDNAAGEQLQQQSPIEFLQSQSSMTQDVNLQEQQQVQEQQQQVDQTQFESQLVGKSPEEHQSLMADFEKFLKGRGDQQSGEQIQQPQQQNLFVQQQQQQQPQSNQQQTQFGYQSNQFGQQQQLSGQSQYYDQQQGQYGGQIQNQFGQQQVNQQNYLQYGQQPQQQVLPQQFQQQQQPQFNRQQPYNPQQNLQLPQQFEPQLQQDVQQQVFAVQSSNEFASPLGQLGNENLNANSYVRANPPDYAPVGNSNAIIDAAYADPNRVQSGAETQFSQQFEPQLEQNIQQEVFAVQPANEVARLPDQLGNVGNDYLNANSNEPVNPPDYAPVGNLNAIIDAAYADPNSFQSSAEIDQGPVVEDSGAEIDQSPVVEDSPDPLPASDILNNRLVPFNVSRQRRFQEGMNKAKDPEVDANEADEEDAPIQVQPDAYGTLKEEDPSVQEKKPTTAREPEPDPSNPDWNFKGAVVNDGVSHTNPRLWGAKTLTTPGLRTHLSKNDAKFAPAAE